MPRGGELRVSARAEDGRAHIRVEDTGAGVPPDERTAVFERIGDLYTVDMLVQYVASKLSA